MGCKYVSLGWQFAYVHVGHHTGNHSKYVNVPKGTKCSSLKNKDLLARGGRPQLYDRTNELTARWCQSSFTWRFVPYSPYTDVMPKWKERYNQTELTCVEFERLFCKDGALTSAWTEIWEYAWQYSIGDENESLNDWDPQYWTWSGRVEEWTRRNTLAELWMNSSRAAENSCCT